jgi:hypothetical protein
MTADEIRHRIHELEDSLGNFKSRGAQAKIHSNCWIPNRACAEALLRSAGFAILDHPEEEIFLCRRQDLPGRPLSVFPARPQIGESRP